MASALRRALPFALIGVASLWLVARIGDGMGDWRGDSWPAVHALASGHLSEYLSAKAMMGPFSTLVEAPFVAIAGGDAASTYRWAAFPCLLAVGLLGLYLARIAGRRGASRVTQVLLAGLCLVNPITIEALNYGHPEEILTAALAVGAVAAASEDRQGWTAILLGLAVASKQWAVLAILPALMALPGRRLRVSLTAAGIVALLMLPSLVVSPDSFWDINHSAAATGRIVTPWSFWYPAAKVTTELHHVDGSVLVAHVHEAPLLVGSLSHPLIVALALLVPLGLAVRRGRLGLSGADAMALFALLALMRCVLDPLDNVYYHEPLLLALLGWDALAPRALPLRGLAGAVAALFLQRWELTHANLVAYNEAYIAVLVIAGLATTVVLLRAKRRPVDSPPVRATDRLRIRVAADR